MSKLFAALFVVALTSAAFAQPGPVGPGGPGGPGGAWPGAGAVNPWTSWLFLQPWYPQWSPCTGIGETCVDCTTRMVCTKVGGLQKSCTDPTLPYCNLGQCSATPTAECAPVPATTA